MSRAFFYSFSARYFFFVVLIISSSERHFFWCCKKKIRENLLFFFTTKETVKKKRKSKQTFTSSSSPFQIKNYLDDIFFFFFKYFTHNIYIHTHTHSQIVSLLTNYQLSYIIYSTCQPTFSSSLLSKFFYIWLPFSFIFQLLSYSSTPSFIRFDFFIYNTFPSSYHSFLV